MKSKYDEAFRREAVRLVDEEGRTAFSVERELGLSNGSIYRWRKALLEDPEHPFPGSGRQKPDAAEMKRLKRENEILRQERDILKQSRVGLI